MQTCLDLTTQDATVLPATITKSGGVVLKLITRSDHAAIYSLSRHNILHGYEVFEIRIQKAQERYGKHYPAKEIYPYDEAFGKFAKSVVTLERAEYWFEYFDSRAARRELENANTAA